MSVHRGCLPLGRGPPWERPPPPSPEMGIEAGGTHPTGIHSCSYRFHFSLIFFAFASSFTRCEWTLSVNDVMSWLAPPTFPVTHPEGIHFYPVPLLTQSRSRSNYSSDAKLKVTEQRPCLVPGPYWMNRLTSSGHTPRLLSPPPLICSVS